MAMIQFMMNGVTQMHRLTLCAALPLALIACNSSDKAEASGDDSEAVAAISPVDTIPFETSVVGQFDEPWAMTFLPDGRALVTEKKGKLKLVTFAADGKISSVDVSGMPTVAMAARAAWATSCSRPISSMTAMCISASPRRAMAIPAAPRSRAPSW
jgi:glucose/arabinose dehydrogenase